MGSLMNSLLNFAWALQRQLFAELLMCFVMSSLACAPRDELFDEAFDELFVMSSLVRRLRSSSAWSL
jgi:hypothetical protein